jgi:hypothetical protein
MIDAVTGSTAGVGWLAAFVSIVLLMPSTPSLRSEFTSVQ